MMFCRTCIFFTAHISCLEQSGTEPPSIVRPHIFQRSLSLCAQLHSPASKDTHNCFNDHSACPNPGVQNRKNVNEHVLNVVLLPVQRQNKVQ